MPDLAVHVCAAVVAGKAIRDPRARAVFYVGNCLPDLADKALRLGALSPMTFSEVAHSPFGIACLAYAASMAFPEGWRSRAFRLLAIGALLHALLDTAKSYLGHGAVPWAFPLSLRRFELGWYAPETSPAALLPWALGSALLAELLERAFRAPAPPASSPRSPEAPA